ncbi:MAG: CoA pyrophosphatase [Chloroflexota bacterium]
MTHPFIDALQDKLINPPPQPTIPTDYRAAAVLICLYEQNGRFHLLYTRRTDDLPTHKGQVAFPGGKMDATDASIIAAALREAQEEVGIQPADVTVLGCMEPIETPYGRFVVTPVVATIPWPYPLKLNHSEVVVTFGPPLDWLLDPNNLEDETRYVAYIPYEGEIIWGLTGGITARFLDLIRGGVLAEVE